MDYGVSPSNPFTLLHHRLNTWAPEENALYKFELSRERKSTLKAKIWITIEWYMENYIEALRASKALMTEFVFYFFCFENENEKLIIQMNGIFLNVWIHCCFHFTPKKYINRFIRTCLWCNYFHQQQTSSRNSDCAKFTNKNNGCQCSYGLFSLKRTISWLK